MSLRNYILIATSLCFLGFLSGPEEAQGQVAAGPGVGFRNDLLAPVIVQGVSIINKVQRRGQPFLLQPGKIAWDSNLPQGVRFYTVYDANQRILLPNQAVPVVLGKDQFFSIAVNAGNPVPVKLVPIAVPIPPANMPPTNTPPAK